MLQSNWTPLMIAASAGHEQVVSLLLAKGAQVNAVNNTGQCSLHYAASKDRYQVNINIKGLTLCRQSFVVKCKVDSCPCMCKLRISHISLDSSTWHQPVSKLFNLSVCMHFLSFSFLANTFRQTRWSPFSPTESVDVNNLEWTSLGLGDRMLVRWLWVCMHFVQNPCSSFPIVVCFRWHQFDPNNVTNEQISVVKRIC